MRHALFVCALHKLVHIVYSADRRQREAAVVRTHDKRLRFVIGNAADAGKALHFIDVTLEFGAERRIFNIMYRAVETVFAVYDHTSSFCAEV